MSRKDAAGMTKGITISATVLIMNTETKSASKEDGHEPRLGTAAAATHLCPLAGSLRG